MSFPYHEGRSDVDVVSSDLKARKFLEEIDTHPQIGGLVDWSVLLQRAGEMADFRGQHIQL